MSDGDDQPISGEGRGPPPRRADVDARRGQQSEEESWALFARDLLTSALAVLVVGAYLFAVSGIWPPLVAVESGSMTPNMYKNDLVFVMNESRFSGDGDVNDTGVVTHYAAGQGNHVKFGKPGDVIVYKPNGSESETPIIHRAMLYVEKGERWYERANKEYVGGASSCDELAHCPADYSGFITKGDSNSNYDQVEPRVISAPVKEEWIVGTAEVRIPGLGWLRLRT